MAISTDEGRFVAFSWLYRCSLTSGLVWMEDVGLVLEGWRGSESFAGGLRLGCRVGRLGWGEV